jgi:RND family efflux transporter MFP subunit
MLGLLGATALILVLLIVTMGMWWKNLGGEDEAGRPPPPVAVVLARSEPGTQVVTAPATLLPLVSLRVTAPAAGRVTRWTVAPGERVAAGQVLALIAGGAAGPGVGSRPRRPAAAPRRPRSATGRKSGPKSGDREGALHRAQQRLARAEQASHAAAVALDAARRARWRAAAQRDDLRPEAMQTAARPPRTRSRSDSPDERYFRAGTIVLAELGDGGRSREVMDTRPAPFRAVERPTRGGADRAAAAVRRADADVRTARIRCEQAEARLAAARGAMATAASRSARRPEVSHGRVSEKPSPRTDTAPPDRVPLRAVRAPSSGIIARLTAAAGSRVSSGQPLAQLARAAGRRFRIEAPADRLSGARPGTPCRIRIGGAALPARVEEVAVSEEDRRMGLEVLALAPLPPRAQGTDRGASVEISLSPPAPALTVPVQAVRRSPDGDMVWIVRPGARAAEPSTAYLQPVHVGAIREGKAEIRSGLVPGSRVIVAGMEQLRDGQDVAAIPWALP